MPENRFFIDLSFSENQTVHMDKEETHHLHVMRKKEGDHVELVNGKDQLAFGKILKIEKTHVSVEIQLVNEIKPKLPKIILAQAILKQQKLEWIIEKAVELGVHAFLLFPAHKSEKKSLNEAQQKRLKALSISALKQCGRLDLPFIEQRESLAKWERPEGDLYFGDFGAKPLESVNAGGPFHIFIGPEGGFIGEEKKILESWHAKRITLSPYTLRAETAAIAATAQLIARISCG